MVIYLSIVGTVLISAQNFEYKSHINTSIASYSMPYRLFIPSGYNSNTSYPLVLFLHGAGERGTDNNAQLTANRGATLWTEAANQASHPCFVVAPQCPADKQWVNTNWSLGSYSITNVPMSTELKMVKDIIETLQTQYNIDPSRLYITGLSMGGYGTWDFILRYPTMFKAAIPMCGAGDPTKASLISTLPLWIFHGNEDGAVPVSGSRDMVNAINALGFNNREPFYTEYNKDHVSAYETALNEPNLVNWLFTTNPIKLGLTDITDQQGTITAQGDDQPNLKDNAVDNTATTKWLDLANANPTTRASWIQYQLSASSYVAMQYTITSANDFPDRDPKSWNLLGSNDGSAWTTLDTRTNEAFIGRSQKNSYTFTNSAAYIYYRLQINSVNDPATATGVQLAELEILGIPAVTSVTILPAILNLEKKDIKQLYASIVPANATNTVTWSSSNDAIASVSSTGLVTAKAVGTAGITATSANNNKTATCDVTVVDNGITKFEAEDATLSGFHLVNDQQNYSGTGFVADFGNVGNSVQFSITGATAGSQDIIFRYATADGSAIHLYVNGTMIRKVILASTGSWGGWTDKVDNVTLNAGNNTIKYQKDAGDDGHLNADYLALRNINNSTGIIEVPTSEKESDISLSPNPLSTGSLSITLPEGATQLSIFDITGKTVYKESVTKNEFLIDQSVFKSKGVYIVNVLTTNNSINRKVMVAK